MKKVSFECHSAFTQLHKKWLSYVGNVLHVTGFLYSPASLLAFQVTDTTLKRGSTSAVLLWGGHRSYAWSV